MLIMFFIDIYCYLSEKNRFKMCVLFTKYFPSTDFQGKYILIFSKYWVWGYRPSYPHTLSGRIGKVVASHAEGCKVARSNPGCG